MAQLEDVLQQLHDSEINAGMQTFYDSGMRVWIGDESNGIHVETTINRTANFAAPRKWPERVTAASWLHEVASSKQMLYDFAMAPTRCASERGPSIPIGMIHISTNGNKSADPGVIAGER